MKYPVMFLCVALLATLTGCPQAGSGNAASRLVAARLQSGGTYYLITDKSAVAAQFDFLAQQFTPKFQQALSTLPIPVELATIRHYFDRSVAVLGIAAIQATGASSTVLIPGDAAQGVPTLFHNRYVLITDPHAPQPGLLSGFLNCHAGFELAEELRQTPDSALALGVGELNFSALYQAVIAVHPLPPEAETLCKLYFQTGIADAAAGLSGAYRSMLLAPAVPGGTPDFQLVMPDADNRLFKLIARLRTAAPEAQELVIELADNPWRRAGAFQRLFIRRGDGTMTISSAADCAARIAAAVKSGKTLARDAALRRACRKLPPHANGYTLCRWEALNAGKLPGNDPGWNAGALTVDKYALNIRQNSFYDWNGLPVYTLMTMLHNVATSYLTVASPAPAAKPVAVVGSACPGRLKQLVLGIKMYELDYNEKYPKTLDELQQRGYCSNPDIFQCPEAGKFLYAGSPTGALNTFPVIFEMPGHHRDGSCRIAFADGHVETLNPPQTVDSAEELMSYLGTVKKIPEAELNILCQRGRILDEAAKKHQEKD